MFTKFIFYVTFIDKKINSLSQKIKLIFLLVFGFISFCFIFKLNMMTNLSADDFVYSFIWGTDNRVQSLSDVIYSQYRHYMEWGGRSVAHTIVQTILLLGKTEIRFLNSLVYVLFTFTIYWHIKGRNKSHDLFIYCLIHLLLWFFQPDYAGTILWISGSGNYLWCTTIILLFMLPYRLYINDNKSDYVAAKSLFMFFGGVVTGWTNENTSIGMIVMILLFILFYKNRKWKIPAWAISGLIGAIVGCLFLILAPGNFERLNLAGGVNTYWFTYIYKFLMYTDRIFSLIGAIFLTSIILLVLVLKFSNINRARFIFMICIYITGIFVSLYAMLLSPQFPDRAFFGIITFSIIILGITYYNLNFELRFVRLMKLSILALFLFSFIFSFYKAYKDIRFVNDQWKTRTEILKECAENNVKEIKIPAIRSSSRYALGDGPWDSFSLSSYYNMEIEIYIK